MNFTQATEIITQKLERWAESIIRMVPNFIIALVILVGFYFLARGGRLLVQKLLSRVSSKTVINNLTSTLTYLTLLGIGLIFALNILHLEGTVSSLLAGVGIVGLALGFAFQDITANFISGIFMAFRKPIQVGDIIQTKDYMGEVEDIDLRVTVIRTFQGMHILIPNKEVFQSPITNFTKTDNIRIDLEVGVAYRSNLKQVKDITIEAVSRLPFLLEGREVELYFENFGDSAITFKVMFWVHYPNQPGFLKARSEAIMAIKAAYDTNNITIPFPIRTLELHPQAKKDIESLHTLQLNQN